MHIPQLIPIPEFPHRASFFAALAGRACSSLQCAARRKGGSLPVKWRRCRRNQHLHRRRQTNPEGEKPQEINHTRVCHLAAHGATVLPQAGQLGHLSTPRREAAFFIRLFAGQQVFALHTQTHTMHRKAGRNLRPRGQHPTLGRRKRLRCEFNTQR